jgi:O-antigen ligase
LVNRRTLWAALMVAIVAITVVVVAGLNLQSSDSVVNSFQIRFEGNRGQISNNIRQENYRIAFAQLERAEAVWFGIGPRNYQSIDISKLSLDPPLRSAYMKGKLNHAHNLFLTKLIEEGIFGLLALLMFFGFVALALFVDWRHKAWFEWRWFAALGALGVPIIAGMVNTPFYQEHAMLAMAVMGMYLASRRPRSA